ncbi:hypothetical protein HNY73_010418 [Argiope bruennichi]|uniref:DUF5641 domain-containing protein n=1 Tax=Argiope bruennichi TaxID=94029 RepID=A0A8T0F1S4_ARGBR|nr:hypothetical protein HNY73_010418 [Argiope bruennichi]
MKRSGPSICEESSESEYIESSESEGSLQYRESSENEGNLQYIENSESEGSLQYIESSESEGSLQYIESSESEGSLQYSEDLLKAERARKEAEAKRARKEAEAERAVKEAARKEAEAERARKEAEAERARKEAEAKRSWKKTVAERARKKAEARRAKEDFVAERSRKKAEAERARRNAEAKRAREEAEAERAREEAEAERAREEAEAERAREEAEAERAREEAEAERAREEAEAERSREEAERAREEAERAKAERLYTLFRFWKIKFQVAEKEKIENLKERMQVLKKKQRRPKRLRQGARTSPVLTRYSIVRDRIMDYLKRERTQLRRLFTKSLKEVENAVKTEPKEIIQIIPLALACFLQGIPNSDTTDLDEIDSKSLNRRLRFIQKLRHDLRMRFRNEYLAMLVHKGHNREESLSVGDVILFETDGKRLLWPLGIVTEVLPVADVHSRVARVRTVQGEKVRPFQRLYCLEISSSEKLPFIAQQKDKNINTQLPATAVVSDQDSSEVDDYITKVAPDVVTKAGRRIKIPNRLNL